MSFLSLSLLRTYTYITYFFWATICFVRVACSNNVAILIRIPYNVIVITTNPIQIHTHQFTYTHNLLTFCGCCLLVRSFHREKCHSIWFNLKTIFVLNIKCSYRMHYLCMIKYSIDVYLEKLTNYTYYLTDLNVMFAILFYQSISKNVYFGCLQIQVAHRLLHNN